MIDITKPLRVRDGESVHSARLVSANGVASHPVIVVAGEAGTGDGFLLQFSRDGKQLGRIGGWVLENVPASPIETDIEIWKDPRTGNIIPSKVHAHQPSPGPDWVLVGTVRVSQYAGKSTTLRLLP